MSKIPSEVQEFLSGKLSWVSTAAADGTPNATPNGSVQVIDDVYLND